MLAVYGNGGFSFWEVVCTWCFGDKLPGLHAAGYVEEVIDLVEGVTTALDAGGNPAGCFEGGIYCSGRVGFCC